MFIVIYFCINFTQKDLIMRFWYQDMSVWGTYIWSTGNVVIWVEFWYHEMSACGVYGVQEFSGIGGVSVTRHVSAWYV